MTSVGEEILRPTGRMYYISVGYGADGECVHFYFGKGKRPRRPLGYTSNMDPDDSIRRRERGDKPFPLYSGFRHYYGDTVRTLFLAAGVILLLEAVFATGPLTPFWTIVAALILGLFAGITNPKQYWIAFVDLCVSILGLLLFGYFAVSGYQAGLGVSMVMLARVGLALIFFFALYYSAKTLRGRIIA